MEIMAFNEKRHCVFPLVPTACAYAKFNEYFGTLQSSKMEDLQPRGDFCEKLPVRKVLRTEKQRSRSTMGSSKTTISDMKDMVRNTLLRVSPVSGCPGMQMAWWI